MSNQDGSPFGVPAQNVGASPSATPALVPQAMPPTAAPPPPPHPLDATWYVYTGEQSHGPYTGHAILSYVKEGRVEGDTQVVRVGSENWHKLSEDDVLKRFLQGTASGSGNSATAAPGATIVQITNQTTAPRISLDIGSGGEKSPGLALVLSFFIVGLGQLYNGDILKGIVMFIACIALWTFMLGWIINIWSIVDAYSRAKAINAARAQAQRA